MKNQVVKATKHPSQFGPVPGYRMSTLLSLSMAKGVSDELSNSLDRTLIKKQFDIDTKLASKDPLKFMDSVLKFHGEI